MHGRAGFGGLCRQARGANPLQSGRLWRARRADRGAARSGYKISPLDTLTIKVFKMPDLSGDFEVDLTGQISIPLVGNLTATNYTTAELDEQLTERLGAKYLENPDVSVAVKSSASRSVTVDGAVKTAGGFPVTGPVSLMQAVARAGGATPEANLRRVAIFRQIGGKRQAAAFDLASIRRGEMEDPPVYAGDIVIVDGSSIKALQKTLMNSPAARQHLHAILIVPANIPTLLRRIVHDQ